MMAKLSHPRKAKQPDAHAPLRQIAERLAADSAGDDVAAEANTFADLIAMIAREIDETVLPRKVALVRDGREIAILTLSNRRLVKLKSGGQKGVGDAAPGKAAAVFARRLQTIWESGDAPVRLRLTGRAEGFSVSEASCSARDLLEAAEQPATHADAVVFLAELQARAATLLVRESDEATPKTDGETAHFEALRVIDRELAGAVAGKGASAALRQTSARPSFTVLPYGDGLRVVMAREGEGLVLGVVDASETTALMDAWHAAFRT
ncbi:hypothetical protein [Marimonas arenosa]|uniref:Uncharacterized protein n=1 Tax=Marimonas arenosa TaxID=1795305 RepID=A0AAE4B6Y8_9RHOB|nr:hypothetical protein [Marimonas arenosa]MDQ2090891.1 hypothetical protein [Marimonas arenosa]